MPAASELHGLERRLTLFEAANIAAEIITLVALGNSTLGPGLDRVRTSEFRHVTTARTNQYPLNGVATTFSGPLVPDGRGFLMTHFSLYAAVEPPVSGTLATFFGLGYDAITVRVDYLISSAVAGVKASATNSVQAILNRPIIFVFPSLCVPRVSLTPVADPRTALSIGLYANMHGYFIPAAYQAIYQQFETIVKLGGT